MRKNSIKYLLLVAIIISAVLIGGKIEFNRAVSFAEAGDANDPLISKSYFDSKVEELKNYIDQKLSGIGSTGYNPKSSNSWEAVEVQAGQFLVCKDGTEIILRAGTAKAVAVVSGNVVNGLSDVTDGRDLLMDENLTLNHHIIVPRDDGRGAICVGRCFFLVKGDYEIR